MSGNDREIASLKSCSESLAFAKHEQPLSHKKCDYWFKFPPLDCQALIPNLYTGKCEKLSTICCRAIAIHLAKDTNLSNQLVLLILRNVRSPFLLQNIWKQLVEIGGDSCKLHVLFSVYFRDCSSYRFERVVQKGMSILPSIKFLNYCGSVFDQFEFLTVLNIYGTLSDLVNLPSLESLVALSVELEQPDQILQLAKSWNRFLNSDDKKWANLKFLSLPQLQSVKAFDDIFQSVPSLTAFQVNISPSHFLELKQLNSRYKLIENELEYNTTFGKFLKFNSPLEDKMVIDFEIVSVSASKFAKVHYKPDLVDKKLDEIPIYVKTQLKVRVHEVKLQRAVKKPRIIGYKSNMSVESFFGF